MATKKGKIISVISMKGGVGKTILALNLAAIYADDKKKVLLVDMDLYGGAIALNLNLQVEKTIYHFVDDLSNNRYQNFSDYVVPYSDQIDILASPKDPRQANKIASKYIEMILANAIYRYDVILIDMTHSLNKNNINVLDMAYNILYVMTNDPMDLKNTKSFISILSDIEKDNVKIVLNDSLNLETVYFSNFDMKNIIKHKIDYTIPKSLHIKNITKYILDGKILYDNPLTSFKDRSSIKNLKNMAIDLLDETK
ncbi:MAG: AAA family ATPase [Bacilli bacterium]